jgi:hypothetical protein
MVIDSQRGLSTVKARIIQGGDLTELMRCGSKRMAAR